MVNHSGRARTRMATAIRAALAVRAAGSRLTFRARLNRARGRLSRTARARDGGSARDPPSADYAPTVSRTRSTGTMCRLNCIVSVGMPRARPRSWGRCSTGMLYSVSFSDSALRW